MFKKRLLGFTLSQTRLKKNYSHSYPQFLWNGETKHEECSTMECTLELPWPESVNHYKKVGRIVRTKSGKLYQQRVNTDATKQFYHDVWVKIRVLKATTPNWIPLESTIALEVSICLYPPDKRRRDIDNPVKLILDSLQKGGLIPDDYQIARLLIERHGIVPQGKVILRIKEYERK